MNLLSVRSWTLPVAAVVAVWLLLHAFSLSWGLPNLVGMEPDGVAVALDRTAVQFAEADSFRYPPLQYFIWSLVHRRTDTAAMGFAERLEETSRAQFRLRLVVALETLGSALALLVLGTVALGLSPGQAVMGPLFFLLNPLSIYYSHTTNLDQPYLFWLLLAAVAAACGARGVLGKADRAGFFAVAAFGAALSAAMCTKDMVYGFAALPVAAWWLWYWRRSGNRRTVIAEAALFLAAGSAVFAAVYWAAGGSSVLSAHLAWIDSQGVQGYATRPGTLSGRLLLAADSVRELITALDIGLLAAVLLIVLPAAVLRPPASLPARLRNGQRTAMLAIGLGFISLECLFIQIMRFSPPRFYLPMVAGVSLLAGAGIVTLRARLPKTATVCMALCIALSLAGGVDMCWSLAADTRQVLRRELLAFREQFPGARIGLTGLAEGAQFVFRNGRHEPVHCLRDWSGAIFGRNLPACVPVAVRYDCLELLRPVMVVTQLEDVAAGVALAGFGYLPIARVTPVDLSVVPLSLFRRSVPSYALYVRQNGGSVPVPKETVTAPPAEETPMSHLQMLEHCLNWADSIDERRAMARRFAAFAPAPGNDLDLRDYALSPDTLAVWEDGLRMNGQTAEQARVAELRSRLVPAGR